MKPVAVRTLILGAGLVVVLGVGIADTPKPAIEPKHFLHAEHAGYGVSVDEPKQCASCHRLDGKGNVLAPAAQGHAPCMQSGCHAETFLVVSEASAASKDPKVVEAFTKASAFCLACHQQVPWAWKKPSTRVIEAWHIQREHHIEMAKTATSNMDHFAHTKAKKKNGETIGCRDCHAVDGNHKLIPGAPGHVQCQQCHNPTDGLAFAMGECGRCHKQGSRKEFLERERVARGVKLKAKDVSSRPDVDVRACGSAGAAEYSNKKGRKDQGPCFKHETKEHRSDSKGKDVQCKQCHYLVTMTDSDGKPVLSSIADLHFGKIIGDKVEGSRSMQHAACGGCHPHSSQIKLRGGNCQYCHEERTQAEPYW